MSKLRIFSLTKIFIKDFYLNLPIFDRERRKFNTRSIFFWLLIILLVGIIYISYQIINFLMQINQTEIFIDLYLPIVGIILTFQIILVCANIFFFSKDIRMILHMPIKPVELLLAKLNVLLFMIYISEIFFALIPFTLYGLMVNVHFMFYLWEIIVLVFFPILLATIIGSIMLIIMRFTKFIKNKDLFQLIITSLLLMVVFFIQFKVTTELVTFNNNEEVLQQVGTVNDKFKNIGNYFLVINPSIDILSNPNSFSAFIALLKLIIFDFIGLMIFLVIGKFTYLKDILRNIVNYTNKKKKAVMKNKKSRSHSIGMTYILKETKMLIRQPTFFMQCVFPVIIVLITCIMLIGIFSPVIDELLQTANNGEFNKMSFNAEILCYILIILQVLFSISNISLTAVSRDGRSALFVKYIPVELYKQFIYKIMPQVLLNLLLTIVLLSILWYFLPFMNIIYIFFVFVVAMMINFINSYLMLVVDLRRPNLNWSTEYAVVKKSNNKMFQYVFMIINVLFLMYLAKIFENVNIIITCVSEILIFVIIFIVIDRCVKKWQDKLFNKII